MPPVSRSHLPLYLDDSTVIWEEIPMRGTHRSRTRDAVTAAAIATVTLASTGCGGARMQNNETSAIASMRTVSSAQATHAAFCGGSYAASLPALGARGYLTPDLAGTAEPVKMGYRFTMTVEKGDVPNECGEPVTNFELRASPEQPGTTGEHYYRTSSDGTIHAATTPDFSDARPLP